MSNSRLKPLCKRVSQCLTDDTLMLSIDEPLSSMSFERKFEIFVTFVAWCRFLLGDSVVDRGIYNEQVIRFSESFRASGSDLDESELVNSKPLEDE